MEATALLLTAALFGGMVLYSAGFAGFLFKVLPPNTAGASLRRAFPVFYLLVIATSLAAAVMVFSSDLMSALALAAIAVTTVPTRQLLMPAINDASDAGNKRRFGILHGVSVLITLAHIALAGWVLIRFL
ncbi:DUF4149 domain-containing protein [Marinobacter confluentis]|uniref:DUF4149 domain-containing protein n=1 Tax=Marinobacter confluentis TaxID=1697557 RepID=A0A4Z1BD91_9GAMM|nr:DUF4149 domain-containing protein [Marinobacter confluentis]TGN40224.1 DUF4149 domain-containing protein [Marinobacter confluentis]